MEHENLNLKEVMESRRHAVEESLRIISVDELKALTDKLFPYADHPWLETFLNVVSDPTSGTFHHAVTDDRLDEVNCPSTSSTATTKRLVCGSSESPERGLCNRKS